MNTKHCYVCSNTIFWSRLKITVLKLNLVPCLWISFYFTFSLNTAPKQLAERSSFMRLKTQRNKTRQNIPPLINFTAASEGAMPPLWQGREGRIHFSSRWKLRAANTCSPRTCSLALPDSRYFISAGGRVHLRRGKFCCLCINLFW